MKPLAHKHENIHFFSPMCQTLKLFAVKDQKMALKMLSLGHVDAASPMRLLYAIVGESVWLQPQGGPLNVRPHGFRWFGKES